MGLGASTLAIVGAAASVAGAGMDAMGAARSGEAASEAAGYNAQVQTQQAQIENQNATWAAQAGEAQAGAQQQKTRAQVGAIKAAEAADNLDVNSGSAVDVRSSAAALGELSALNIRSNAAKQAYGYQTQSWSDQAQANLDQADAAYSAQAGEIGAGADLLTGLGSADLNWEKYLSGQGVGANGGNGTAASNP